MRDFEHMQQRMIDIVEGHPGNHAMIACLNVACHVIHHETDRENQIIGLAFMMHMLTETTKDVKISLLEVVKKFHQMKEDALDKMHDGEKPDWKAQFR